MARKQAYTGVYVGHCSFKCLRHFYFPGLTFFYSLLFVFNSPATFGQLTVQVGDDTDLSNVIPIAAYYGYSYTQQLYTAADLTAAGAPAGRAIQKLRFYLETAPGNMANASNWTVYLGNSSRSQFAHNTDWEPVSNLTQVFSGTVNFVAGDWVEITMPLPFVWDGSGNIIVAVKEQTPGYTNDIASWRVTGNSAGTSASIYYRSDNHSPDPAAPPTATGLRAEVPNIQFEFATTPCAGLIPDPEATLASEDQLCGTGIVDLETQNTFTGFSDITYRWQYSTDTMAGWQDIANSNFPSASVSVDQSTWYRAVLTCDGNQGSSAPVQVIVHPIPMVTFPDSNIVYCDGTVVTLNASGAERYNWFPAQGLDADTGFAVQASPLQSTLYTVVGIDQNNCMDSAQVVVTPATGYHPDVVHPSSECNAGTPLTFAVEPAVDGTGAGLEYELLDASGAVIAPWQTASSFTFTPASEGDLRYAIVSRLAGCTTVPDTARVTVYYGLDAEVSITKDCAGMANTISLGNPAGAGIFTSADLQYSFDTAYLPTDVSLHGHAARVDNRMVLTPSAAASKGGMQISMADTLNPEAISVSFDLTTDQVMDIYGTGGADGFAWSFGDDADYSSGITTGAGSKLRVVFDAADNSMQNGNVKGIYVSYGYGENAQMGPSSAGVLAYSPDISWKGRTDQRVEITIGRDNRLRLTYAGNVIFDTLQLPAEYAEADKSGWSHLFSAFTGGDAMRHAIDDLKVLHIARAFVYGVSAGGSGVVPVSWQSADTFSNLNSPDSFDVWIAAGADPQSCNRFLGTYRFWHPITLTNLSSTELTTCDADDGSITFEGLLANVSYTLTYKKDGADTTVIAVADTAGHITLTGLEPAVYSDLTIAVDDCAVAIPNTVTIPEPLRPALLAFPGSANTDCTQPNGSIILFSTGFVGGTTYEVWYNQAQQGSFIADASGQIQLTGLSPGSYTDMHVITPQLCSSDTVPAFTVSGVLPDALITAAVTTDPTGCNASDGTITLSGNFNNGTTPYLSFLYDGIPGVAAASGTGSEVQVSGLPAGRYDSIRVIDGCPSNAWGPVILPGHQAGDLPSVSAAAVHTQGPGVEVSYTNTHCEPIAVIYAPDSLGHVTAMVTVRNGTQLYRGTEPYIGRFYDILAGNNGGGRVTLYFTDAEINAYNVTVNNLNGTLYPAIDANGGNLQVTAFHSIVPGNGPEGYNTEGTEAITPLNVVHNAADGIWEVTFDTDSFSGFFVHTNPTGAPLPVKLHGLSAENKGAVNLIYWQTGKEPPGTEFSVQHSPNGKHFNTIGTLRSKGRSGGSYTFTHTAPEVGINYYRVESLSPEGRYYSKVVSAKVDDARLHIHAYPNPAGGLLTVETRGTVSGHGTLLLTDISGRVIGQRSVESNGTVTFPMQHLAQGIYILKYQDGSVTRTFKLSRQ